MGFTDADNKSSRLATKNLLQDDNALSSGMQRHLLAVSSADSSFAANTRLHNVHQRPERLPTNPKGYGLYSKRRGFAGPH